MNMTNFQMTSNAPAAAVYVPTIAMTGLSAALHEDSESDDDEPVEATTEATQGVTGMTFSVHSKSTIPSDNAPHRVTVATLSLSPEFHYIAIPRKSAHAFLKAKAKNTSDYAFLSGPVNIYLDKSFVATSRLREVSPQEEFECSLGVDASVRIAYPPRTKHQVVQGFVTRTHTVKVHQQVKVRNGRNTPIIVQVLDQVPVSELERLKIELVEPLSVKKMDKKPGQVPHKKIILTGPKEPKLWLDKNVLEWVLKVDKGQEATVAFSYSVTFPSSEAVVGLL
jgi:uncharacterized protein (TIGR02231 family)